MLFWIAAGAIALTACAAFLFANAASFMFDDNTNFGMVVFGFAFFACGCFMGAWAFLLFIRVIQLA